jgi:hypothetical protein
MTRSIPYHPCLMASCLEIPAVPRQSLLLPFSNPHKEDQ